MLQFKTVKEQYSEGKRISHSYIDQFFTVGYF